MSNYRDDMSDTATIADRLLSKLRGLGESTAFASSVLFFSIFLTTTESLAISDQISDQQVRAPIVDVMRISDEVVARRHVADMVDVSASADGEVVDLASRLLTEEGAIASDELTFRLYHWIDDPASISDEASGTFGTSQLVFEMAIGGDALLFKRNEEVAEDLVVTDEALGYGEHKELALDAALISDELLDTTSIGSTGVGAAAASSELIDHLSAAQLVVSGAAIEDEVLSSGAGGQVWTASLDAWALSRYDPFVADDLIVINGTLYASMAGGVYALDGQDEEIEARLLTGRFELGEPKVAPHSAYMEYELDGDAHMTVYQSDGRSVVPWQYALTKRASDTDTSGRFIFGKGLRGKRFAFELTTRGSRMELYELTVAIAKFERKL